MKSVLSLIIGFVLLIISGSEVNATHLRAADILLERVCGTLRYKITIIAYVNTNTTSEFGIGFNELYFGDGTFLDIPRTPSTPRPDLGKNVGIATFTTFHEFSAEGIYKITYSEKDRNANVVNIARSDDVPYNTSVQFDTRLGGCNKFPVLTVTPLDKACLAVAFTHNPGAIDAEGDSLSYELGVPFGEIDIPAAYTPPNDPRFYTNFSQGNEDKTGVPVFQIDSLTGTLLWDAAGLLGEYNIAFKIKEWRKNAAGVFELLSTTVRDMQIIVEECVNARPIVVVPSELCVEAGTLVTGIITGTDIENDLVKIELTREVFNLTSSPATATPDFINFSPPPAVITVSWQTNCTHVRQSPYSIIAKITDDPVDGPKLTSFNTWRIKVLAPAPTWKNPVLNVVNKTTILEWNPASCSNVQSMQIWRKVGSYLFKTGPCVSGMPSGTGYQLIATVNAGNGTYTDTNTGAGLVQGATYCYRLVGLINDTRTKVSDEICVGPIEADAPVITHVSVVKTDTAGSLRVSWRSPFNINKSQFPEPYKYSVYRAFGFVGSSGILLAGDQVSDTTFLDQEINTRDSVYNYRIVLYSKPAFATDFIPVDTSAVAASVRLAVEPAGTKMILHWRDSVPWSNTDPANPWHYIYRGEGIPDENKLTLIDSVNVTLDEFNYIDSGQWNNSAINRATYYSYKVMTSGTYGNPAIDVLENYAQLISAYPDNSGVPCAPALTIDKIDCQAFLETATCSGYVFTNSLHWKPETGSGCRIDIVKYIIYASTSESGGFSPIATTTDTLYLDSGLPSFARCYYITSVDSRGIESSAGKIVCQDNCPYFFLPNIFTPNGDSCNDFFTSDPEQSGLSECPIADNLRCSRFVAAAEVTVYNRWGRPVYSNNGEGPVKWNGRDSDGTELPVGIYYYYAVVQFNMIDPAQRRRIYKGWVKLAR